MASQHVTDAAWTVPYHGVSHRRIAGRQCTIEDHGPHAIDATVFGRRGSGAVQADAIEAPVRFATMVAAQTWCEDIASRFARCVAGEKVEESTA